jgi:CHASE2 domain-containing sensor protein
LAQQQSSNSSVSLRDSIGKLISFEEVRKKSLRYWISAIIVLVISFTATPYIYNRLNLAQSRARLFQYLLEKDPRPLEPRFVKVVLVEDDEYWAGYPAGRRPIKRDYLAQLVDRLVEANVHVIALDFDLRLPNPENSTPQIPFDYKRETDTLIDSIIRAAQKGKKIVLARTVWIDDKGYYLDPDIYDPYGVCTRVGKDGRWVNSGTPEFPISARINENISCGYIALPYDILMVPGQLQLKDGSYVDSFALALARAMNAKDATRFVTDNRSEGAYGSYIPDGEFDQYNAEIPAHDLLNTATPELSEKLDGRSVIVGAHWSSFAYGRGEPVDVHPTPIGNSVGALIHANFAEAILDSRTFTAIPHWVTVACEVLFSVVALIVFAASVMFRIQVVAIILLSLILVIIEWTALHQFGSFFDAFVPLLALWLHSVYDRLLTSIGPGRTT